MHVSTFISFPYSTQHLQYLLFLNGLRNLLSTFIATLSFASTTQLRGHWKFAPCSSSIAWWCRSLRLSWGRARKKKKELHYICTLVPNIMRVGFRNWWNKIESMHYICANMVLHNDNTGTYRSTPWKRAAFRKHTWLQSYSLSRKRKVEDDSVVLGSPVVESALQEH